MEKFKTVVFARFICPNPERCAYNYGLLKMVWRATNKGIRPLQGAFSLYRRSSTETYMMTAWRQSSYNWITSLTSQHAPDSFPRWLTGLVINVCADSTWERVGIGRQNNVKVSSVLGQILTLQSAFSRVFQSFRAQVHHTAKPGTESAIFISQYIV
jgi:hypothetical protein